MDWSLFLRALRKEKEAAGHSMSPVVVIAAPTTALTVDVKAALGGAPVTWRGVVRRADTEAFVERCLDWPSDDLVARVGASVTTEVAGWDPGAAWWLTRLTAEQRVDPRETMAVEDGPAPIPCWENGLVDVWDGRDFTHPSALSSATDKREIDSRVWRGQVRELLPFVERVRTAFAVKYVNELMTKLPIEKTFFERVEVYAEPGDLEVWDILDLLRPSLPEKEGQLLGYCHAIRTATAHFKPVEARRIIRAASLWRALTWI
jgi:hypothetical protein